MSEPTFSLRVADWPDDREPLQTIRDQVFVNEQQVPRELEWDGLDADALHLLAVDAEKTPIGCVRLLPSGQIGRMAVIKSWRNKGLGKALLERLLDEAAHGAYPPLFLKAQLTALPFYAKHGFSAEGDVFMDAGIPHRLMRRDKV